MTKKRFIKLIMSCEKGRNEAQTLAAKYHKNGFSYADAYSDFMLKHGIGISLANGFRKVAIKAEAAKSAFLKLGIALRKAAQEQLRNIKNENTCVCCGETIPEGRQVCPKCENKEREK